MKENIYSNNLTCFVLSSVKHLRRYMVAIKLDTCCSLSMCDTTEFSTFWGLHKSKSSHEKNKINDRLWKLNCGGLPSRSAQFQVILLFCICLINSNSLCLVNRYVLNCPFHNYRHLTFYLMFPPTDTVSWLDVTSANFLFSV